jgi:hypothetical protein
MLKCEVFQSGLSFRGTACPDFFGKKTKCYDEIFFVAGICPELSRSILATLLRHFPIAIGILHIFWGTLKWAEIAELWFVSQ